ncbi:MAG: M48 family metallopeptidase [Verrucomicrobia bacterium]|nr:M48 family metallopeptidase [Verrucomicrobiota bacterium]
MQPVNVSFYDAIASNKRRSIVLCSFFILIIGALGMAFGVVLGDPGFATGLALIFAGGSAWISYYHSDSMVLAMSGARPVVHEQYPFLDNVIEGLAIAAGVPKPRAYIIEDTAMNAFATGRDPQHAVVCVTSGLLTRLNRAELEGVIAHEMSHVQNYDIRFMSLVVVMVGVITLLSDWFLRSLRWRGVGGSRRSGSDGRGGGAAVLVFLVIGLILAILAPIVAALIQAAVSRQREFMADANGVRLTRYPKGLADALRKLGADTEPLEAANKATAHLYIVSPLMAHGGRVNSWFSTHPPIEERIKRLEAMGASA